MATELRVLIVEDDEDDALLTLRQLERSGYAPISKRVQDGASMRAALAEDAWDLVLSDWSMPQFTAPDALAVLKESGLDIPFIIVSGTVGEDAAVAAMRAGARDYIVKGRLTRLSAAVERELREHEDRRARRRAEETLARTEKLRALGQMAAGVSHDLKNILNPLFMQLQLARKALERGESAQVANMLGEMKRMLGRGVETLDRLRSYSKETEGEQRAPVDLDRLIHEAREIAKPRIAARGGAMAVFREELGAPPPFEGRPGEIVSALVNLIINAIDAFTSGGTITLRTGKTGERAWAQVSDDGPGMPPDVAQKVFEPFFTTKGAEGTGLGLAMVKACAESHGGSVELETEPGKGTTFTLWFPCP